MTKKTPSKKDTDTIYDSLMDEVDAIYIEEIKTGKLFEKSIEEITYRMDGNMLLKFFDRVDSYSMIDFVADFGLNKAKVNAWLEEYNKFRTKIWAKDNRLINHRTTNLQVILYYYLVELKIIRDDVFSQLVPDAVNRSRLLSYLFNKDEHNVRRALRNANIIGKKEDYYTDKNLNQLKELAEQIKCEELSNIVRHDLIRSSKRGMK